jgi:enoyl-CoA hydratase
MAETRIIVERRGAVAGLALVGGEGHRLSEGVLAGLANVLSGLADEPDVGVAVLTGADGVFCSGWDWDEVMPTLADSDGPRRLTTMFQQIAETPLPVIAAIAGDATGAGLELALACDIRLAAEDARFGFPDNVRGLLPLGGGASRLARLVGRGLALRLLLTGETIVADEALGHGLVSAVHHTDQLLAEAERLANVIAGRGPIALRFAKEAINRGVDMPLDHALRFETDLTIILQSTADRAEGVRAFAEKRTPRFGGQ